MSNILDTLVESTKERYKDLYQNLDEIKALANKRIITNPNFFYDAIKKKGISFICEIKKASPSKGLISPDFPYKEIAKKYNECADVISVLTEPTKFLGSAKYLTEVKEIVSIPVLRKDFIIYEYQIYEAKHIGADAVLLIVSILDKNTLKKYINLCHELGLGALVEAHDATEVGIALECGAKVIGVNNRNLKDFTVDVHNSERLRKLVPEDVLYIAESGIKTADDIQVLYNAGVNGVLIGETLMRSPDKKAMLDELRKGCRKYE